MNIAEKINDILNKMNKESKYYPDIFQSIYYFCDLKSYFSLKLTCKNAHIASITMEKYFVKLMKEKAKIKYRENYSDPYHYISYWYEIMDKSYKSHKPHFVKHSKLGIYMNITCLRIYTLLHSICEYKYGYKHGYEIIFDGQFSMNILKMHKWKEYNFDFNICTKPYIDSIMSDDSSKILIKLKWNKNNIILEESEIIFFYKGLYHMKEYIKMLS